MVYRIHVWGSVDEKVGFLEYSCSYAHPFRVVSKWYDKDLRSKILAYRLPEWKRTAYVIELRAGVLFEKVRVGLKFKRDWLAILPSSMPGSVIPQ